MNKKIISVLVFLLVLSLLGQSLTVMASEPVDRRELSYEESLELALSSSRELRIQDIEVRRADDIRERAADQYKYVNPMLPQGLYEEADYQTTIGLWQADIGARMAREELDVKIDQIAYQVRQQYNELVRINKQIETAKTAYEVAQKEFDLNVLKLEHGMNSRYDVQSEQRKLNEQKEQVDLLKEQYISEMVKFRDLIGGSPSVEYVLTDEPAWNPVEDFNINRHVQWVRNNSVSAWMAKQQIQLSEIEVKMYDDGHTIGMLRNPVPKSAKRLETQQAELSAEETIDQLELNTRNLYHSIKQIQKQKSILESEREQSEQDLAMMELRLELGLVTPLQVEQLKTLVQQKEYNLTELTLQHQTTVMLLDKPWAASR